MHSSWEGGCLTNCKIISLMHSCAARDKIYVITYSHNPQKYILLHRNMRT